VKRVFWLGETSLLLEFEASSNDPEHWTKVSGGVSGVTTANDSGLAARWEQNFKDRSDTLSLLYQARDSNAAVLSTLVTNSTGSFNDFNAPGPYLTVSEGSVFAMGSTGAPNTLLLYSIDPRGVFVELGYEVMNASVFGTTGKLFNLHFSSCITAELLTSRLCKQALTYSFFPKTRIPSSPRTTAHSTS
jgi:hypothetical protein